MRLERDLSRWLRTSIEGVGGYCIKIRGSVYGRSGVPDLHVTHELWTGYIETKRKDGEVTPKQAHEIRKIREAGGAAVVVRCSGLTRYDSLYVEDEAGKVMGAVAIGADPKEILKTLREVTR